MRLVEWLAVVPLAVAQGSHPSPSVLPELPRLEISLAVAHPMPIMEAIYLRTLEAAARPFQGLDELFVPGGTLSASTFEPPTLAVPSPELP